MEISNFLFILRFVVQAQSHIDSSLAYCHMDAIDWVGVFLMLKELSLKY